MNTNFSNISLEGLRVLNTRPIEQGQALSMAIAQAGGTAFDCPALSIVPTKSSWFHLLPNLNTVNQAIFTSANAVIYAFNIFHQKQLIWPVHIEITTIGKSTASKLEHYQVPVTNIPATSTSECLLNLLSLRQVDQKTVLLFKGEGGRLLIPETLKARGAKLIELAVYRRAKPHVNQAQLQAWWRNKAVDIILFTSYEAMQNTFAMFDKPAHSWLKNLPCLVISKRLAEAASLLGIRKIIRCSPETILDALDQFNKGFIHE
jgi:uroporphyrinogen-III synthase